GAPPHPGGRGRGTAPTTLYQFTLIAYERNTGKEAWRSVAIETVPHESGHGTNTHASASPITDGKHLYASFGSQGIFCFDMTGKEIWKRDLGDMQTRNAFGEGASPALHKDTLVVAWDHEGQSAIYALDAKTGEVKWATGREEATAWGTPVIVEHKGKTQVITNGTTVRSYDLATGTTLWECPGQATNPIATPIVRDGIAYCMTGYRGYAVFAIPLDSKGVVPRDKAVWNRTDAGPYVSTGVLYGDLLYYTKSRDAIMIAANPKTGEKVIEETRLPGLSSMYASMVAAKDRIYITSREGTTLVIKHGPKLQVLATNTLDEGIDASPALVGKQMFIRGQKHLYCVEAK
ncbi:MAG: PQQ-binding-like beta-propeller repeat protein, partial [Phycisphaeraceae bacterium]